MTFYVFLSCCTRFLEHCSQVVMSMCVSLSLCMCVCVSVCVYVSVHVCFGVQEQCRWMPTSSTVSRGSQLNSTRLTNCNVICMHQQTLALDLTSG